MVYDVNRLRLMLPHKISTLKVFDEIDSTSSEARRYSIDGGSSAALFLADRQIGGRGRVGRSFYSPSGVGIYMSLLLSAPENVSDLVLLTSAAAVAVRRAILKVTGIKTDIKWVNDLYFNGKKVCGILCEYLSEQRQMIIGVGINLYPSEFPKDIADTAGALLNTRSDDLTREALTATVAGELLSITDVLKDGGFMNEYRENSAILGKEIRYIQNGVSLSGVATHIDERGYLHVRDAEGEIHILSSGEISVRFN